MIKVGDLVYIPSHTRLWANLLTANRPNYYLLNERGHFLVTDKLNQKISILHDGQIWQVEEKEVYPTNEPHLNDGE